jgi:hypothetical protein
MAGSTEGVGSGSIRSERWKTKGASSGEGCSSACSASSGGKSGTATGAGGGGASGVGPESLVPPRGIGMVSGAVAVDCHWWISVSCVNGAGMVPSAMLAVASKMSEQCPQRTQPSEIFSWSGTTRNIVPQAGQLVIRLMSQRL